MPTGWVPVGGRSRVSKSASGMERSKPMALWVMDRDRATAWSAWMRPSAASCNVCPVNDAAESFVVGVVVAPDDVPADHAGLLLVGGVVGPVEREVAQGRELGLD